MYLDALSPTYIKYARELSDHPLTRIFAGLAIGCVAAFLIHGPSIAAIAIGIFPIFVSLVLVVPVVHLIATSASSPWLSLTIGRLLRAIPVIGFFPLEYSLPQPIRGIFPIVLFATYLFVAIGILRPPAFRALIFVNMLGLVAIIPFVPRGAEAFILQGGIDDIVYALGGGIFLSKLISYGELPFWNPYYLLGTPFSADPIWGAWYPLNLISASYVALLGLVQPNASIADLSVAFYNTSRIALSFATASGCYFLIRLLGAGRIAALAITAIYPFALDVQVYNWWSLALLPWLLYGISNSVRDGRLAWALITGIISGAMILGGQMKMIAYCVIVAATWTGAEIIISMRDDKSAGRRRQLSLQLAAIPAVTLLVGALAVIPLFQLAPTAVRFINDPATGGPMLINASSALTWAQVRVADWTPSQVVYHLLKYISAPLLVPFVLAFLTARENGRIDWFRIFLGLTVIVLLDLAMASHGHVARWLYDYFLPWRSFRAHYQAMYPLLLAIGILASVGLHSIRRANRLQLILAGLAAAGIWTWVTYFFGDLSVARSPLQATAELVTLFIFLVASAAFLYRREVLMSVRSGLVSIWTPLCVVLAFTQTASVTHRLFSGPDLISPKNLAYGKETLKWIEKTESKKSPYRITGEWAAKNIAGEVFAHGGAYHFGIESSGGYMALALKSSIHNYGFWSPEDRNIRYLIALAGLTLPADLSERVVRVHTIGPYNIYMFRKPKQRAWLAEQAPNSNELHPASGTVRITLWTPRRLEAEVNSKEGNVLLISQAYDRNWVATVNGAEVPIHEIRGFQGVYLPRSEVVHVKVRYRDTVSIILAALAATVILLFSALVYGRAALQKRDGALESMASRRLWSLLRKG